MLYREIGTSGVKASCVAFGTWELAGNVWGAVTEEEAIKTIHAALDGGITMIDTAASYGGGRSEEIVGKALAGIRDQVVLVTKGGAHFNPQKNDMERDLTPAAVRRDVEESLSRLGTDYIDLFFCHYPDPGHPVEETMGALEALRKEGKIRMIGLSNYSEEDVRLFCEERDGAGYTGLYEDREGLERDVLLFRTSVLGEGDQVEGENLTPVLQPQASFVLMDPFTGQVLAINGGRGEKAASRTFNRAADSLRQPGSVFKVLTAFAPALDGMNATLATVYYDEPYQVGKKAFRNWYGRFYGYCNIREAIAYSMNIVAVRCMMETVSPQLGVWYAQNMGISTLTEQDYNASTALGGVTDGVSNLELTAAFGAIGAGGVYTSPTFFTKVLDHDGNVLLESRPESRQALKPETAFLLTDAMKDVMTGRNKFAATPINPTGRRAALDSMAAAGKSGTTTDNKDLWFVGYTPYYAAGIWSGNDNNQPVTGGTSYHKDIWKKIMDRVHEGLDNTGFGVPEGIRKCRICIKSGKRAVEGVCEADPRGSAVYSEYFAEGTIPASFCDIHVKATVCAESGGAAGEFCPETEERVFLALPEGAGETEDTQYVIPELCVLHQEESTEDLTGQEGESLWESWESWPWGNNEWETVPGQGDWIWPGNKPWWADGPSQGEGTQPESRPPFEGGSGESSAPSQEESGEESRPPYESGESQSSGAGEESSTAWESSPPYGGGTVPETSVPQEGNISGDSIPDQESRPIPGIPIPFPWW